MAIESTSTWPRDRWITQVTMTTPTSPTTIPAVCARLGSAGTFIPPHGSPRGGALPLGGSGCSR